MRKSLLRRWYTCPRRKSGWPSTRQCSSPRYPTACTSTLRTWRRVSPRRPNIIFWSSNSAFSGTLWAWNGEREKISQLVNWCATKSEQTLSLRNSCLWPRESRRPWWQWCCFEVLVNTTLTYERQLSPPLWHSPPRPLQPPLESLLRQKRGRPTLLLPADWGK